MAKPKTLDAKINSLTHIVEKGFAALATDFAHRPTNSEVAAIINNEVAATNSRGHVEEILRDPTHTAVCPHALEKTGLSNPRNSGAYVP